MNRLPLTAGAAKLPVVALSFGLALIQPAWAGKTQAESPPPAAAPPGPPWTTSETYPPRALREEREGRTVISGTVNTEGRFVDCVIVESSGSADLDEASCATVMARGRWQPARDSEGKPVASIHRRVFEWRMPKD